MSLGGMIWRMLGAALAAILVCGWAASSGNKSAHAVSAAGFAAAAILLAWIANRPFWSLDPARVRPEAAAVAGRRNALALAIVYGWGAFTLLTIYPLLRLDWHHWWQYGGLMAVIAIGLVALARWQASNALQPMSGGIRLNLLRATLLHAIAAASGVVWLLISGKLASPKADWVANHVFVAGGLAIAAISVIAAITQMRLERRG